MAGNNLFFSVKAVSSDSNTVIPFIIRTQWGYTRWSRISFSFFAETSSQLGAGYYQVDTASLSACFSGKEIVTFIPFIDSTLKAPKALTFLNGFEISSIGVNSTYRTPFEIQLLSNNVTAQGIHLVISSTSATQVLALFVSYIVYDAFIQNLVVGSYVYNKYAPVASLVFTPPIGVSNNNVAFHGFSGFIASNNGAGFALGAALIRGNITFASDSSIYYLSYNYFFLIGGPCGQCVGYNINYNGSCVATCPPSSYFDGVTCIVCKTGDVWNGKECITPAPVNPVNPTNTTNPTNSTTPSNSTNPVNPINNSSNSSNPSGQTNPVYITCPAGTYWDSQQLRCLPCKTGCATCVDCYSCSTCSLGYYQQKGNPFCDEICGDGKRYILACDDGNTINGDGCSSNCEIETGFFCTGGSSTSPDVCTRTIPKALQFSSSGQSRVYGKIIINVRVNYLPQALITSANDCRNNCKDVLVGKFTSGDTSAISIISSYITNSQLSFSVEVNFGREPIGMFSMQIGLNPIIAAKYFSGVDTSAVLNVNVNPALFAKNLNSDQLD